MKINHLSHSRLQIYRGCTLQYHFNYERQPALWESVSGYGAGSLSHESLEFFFLRPAEERTWENLKADIWKAVKKLKEKDDSIIKDVLTFMKVWLERSDPQSEVMAMYKGKPGVELNYDFILPESGGACTTKIDKVVQINPDTIELVDYKSNWQVMSKDEIENSMQLGIYTLALKEMFPYASTIIPTYDFLRHAVVSRNPFEESDLEFLMQYLDTMYQTIRDDNDPQPNVDASVCRWCPGQKSCEAYQAAIDAEALPGQGQTMGELMLERRTLDARSKAIDNRKTDINRILMSTIKSSDSKQLEVDGIGTARLVQARKTEYGSKTVLDVLGDKAYLVSSISKGKLEKLLPSLEPEQRQRILDSGQLSYGGGWLKIKYEKGAGEDDSSEDS